MDVTNEPPESFLGARIDYVDGDLAERQRLIKSVLDVCKSDPGPDGMRLKNGLKFLEQAVFGRDPTKPWDQGRVVIRNEAEKNKVPYLPTDDDILWLTALQAIMRDQGLCVTTHSSADEACHIVPLWTLKWIYTMDQTAFFWMALLGPRTVCYIKDNLMYEYRDRGNRVVEHSIVDKCCNMICLSGQMRRCWEKGLFTFEPMGYCRRSKGAGQVSELSSMLSSTSISDSTATTAHTDSKPSSQNTTAKARRPDAKEDESPGLFNEGRRLEESDIDAGKEYGIVLRVRWLLKTTTLSGLMDSAPPLDTDPQDLQEFWEELHEELEGLSVLPKNGELIRIWAQEPQELPDWTALELRWTALRIHCLSGRANPEKYNPGYNDADEKFAMMRKTAPYGSTWNS
ncbi:hypothetical protein CcaCcLH18_04321 [Colletotrichum camelliae]|nr:hypothetical protein CcaCcLH18_04321 [Colletotrichum camelliae]